MSQVLDVKKWLDLRQIWWFDVQCKREESRETERQKRGGEYKVIPQVQTWKDEAAVNLSLGVTAGRCGLFE